MDSEDSNTVLQPPKPTTSSTIDLKNPNTVAQLSQVPCVASIPPPPNAKLHPPPPKPPSNGFSPSPSLTSPFPPTPNVTSPLPTPRDLEVKLLGVCTQLTYYEFAKEELEQLHNGVSDTGTATTSFTSSSSDTQNSSQPTGQTTPEDHEKHLQHAEDQDYAHQHQQQQHHVEGFEEGEGVLSGARHYSVHRDEQQEPGGEETSGARQYRYCLCTVLLLQNACWLGAGLC